MPQLPRSYLVGVVIALWAHCLLGQNGPFVTITPHIVTMTIGDSRPFRLVNQDGKTQPNVSWSVSDADALQTQGTDELVLTAKRAGNFRLDAHSPAGDDEIEVRVVEGAMVPGTIKWSGPVAPGCKATHLTQAVPTQNGPDLYEETQCADGHYVTAYTSDGVQLWRRRITTENAVIATPTEAITQNQQISKRIDIHSASVCDQIPVGTDQESIRSLLQKHSLSFTEKTSETRMWVVEENGTECRLWFDAKSMLAKKRRTLTSE